MAESLDRAEVRRIARLARLELSDAEIETLGRELASVLAHFEAIDAARAVAGLPSVAAEGPGTERIPDRGLTPHLSEDVPPSDRLSHGPEAMAPEWRDGFFLVPRVPALEEPDA